MEEKNLQENVAETEKEVEESSNVEATNEKDELTLLQEELEKLKTENQDLLQQVATLKNEYAKAYADVENTKKRLLKEAEQNNKYRIQSFALEILPVLDNCKRALEIETTDLAYRKGVEMIVKQLVTALQKEGVEEINALNQPFDPNWHQALMSESVEGVEPNTVIQVLQSGYKLKDRLLRAAMVKVSE